MNNIYISVSEGDKYDSLIIGDTDSIIIRKTNGYYGEILLYFITGTDTIYVDNLYKNIYRIHPHSFSYKTIRRDGAFNVLDSFPMKGGISVLWVTGLSIILSRQKRMVDT